MDSGDSIPFRRCRKREMSAAPVSRGARLSRGSLDLLGIQNKLLVLKPAAHGGRGGAPLSCEMLATRRHTSSYGVKPGSRSPSRRHRRTGSFSPHLGRPRSAPKECLNLECGETPFGWPACHAALLATQTTRVEKDQACAGRAAANQQDSAGKWENAKLQESDGLACGSCAKLDVRTSPKSPSHLPHLRSHSSPGESDVGKPERRETRRVVAAKSLGGKKSPRKVQGAQPF